MLIQIYIIVIIKVKKMMFILLVCVYINILQNLIHFKDMINII